MYIHIYTQICMSTSGCMYMHIYRRLYFYMYGCMCVLVYLSVYTCNKNESGTSHVYIFAYQNNDTSLVRISTLVGSLKLQVSFAQEPYKRDYILQKRQVIVRSLPIVCIIRAYIYTNQNINE